MCLRGQLGPLSSQRTDVDEDRVEDAVALLVVVDDPAGVSERA